MAGVRQLKLIGLTILVIYLVFVLHRTGSSAASLVHAQASDQIPHKQKVPPPPPPAQPKNVVNDFAGSNNDDKVDEAINREIEKERTNDTPAKPKEDSASSSNKQVEGAYDPAADLTRIRSLAPMVIFSKSYCPYSENLKNLLLKTYTIKPQPTIVELDKHESGSILQDYVKQKSGRGTVPNVLIGSSLESRGGSDIFQEYHEQGRLIGLLEEWGAGSVKVVKNDAPSNA